ncbi:MAG TPA: ATP-binding protein [Saprospiraceae bacterium]|nr:ATP-binding protein [Saprospiraceae bacterium]
MFDNIIFVGGIHGVGKSTICQQICKELNWEYLSASELIKWKDINGDSKTKNVRDIPETQERLLKGLENSIENNKTYLLDGHYCLLNKYNTIEKISMEVFLKISPKAICVILDDIIEIKNRLENRDNKIYKFELLEQLQNCEVEYAKQLSKTLDVSIFIEQSSGFMKLFNHLRKI